MFAIDATIEIIKDIDHKPKIFIKDQSDKLYTQISKKIYNLVINDLKVSGHFSVDLDSTHNSTFEATALSAKGFNLFLKLDLKDASSNNGLNVRVELIDLNIDKSIYIKEYSVSTIKKFPFISHSITIDINSYIKAPSIDWMNRFVVFAKYVGAKKSKIVIGDYTLSYQQTIIQGGLNIFPKWADSKQREIYYTSLSSGVPTLYKINIFSGKRQAIYHSDGMIVCSDVSKNGDKIILSMAPNGHSDIYVLDLAINKLTRVSRYKGIDVNGHFINNDKQIVFISDRLGTPNIFLKNLSGGGVEKMVDFGSNNSSCSTYKDYIIYSSKERKSNSNSRNFNLYLISSKSNYVRMLTSKGINQFPQFSDDGESVLYIKRYKGISSLGILRLNFNKSFLFPLKINRLQSIDW